MNSTATAITGFPQTLIFPKAFYTCSFETEEDLAAWLAAELEFWQRLANQASQSNWDGMHALERLVTSVRELTQDFATGWRDRILNFQANYIPSDGFHGFIKKELNVNAMVATLTVAELVVPGIVPQNQNYYYIEAKVLATVLRTGSYAPGFGEQVQRATAEATSSRRDSQEFLDKTRDVLTSIQEEWDTKIKGFEAKVALQAPKEYWANRAKHHKDAGAKAAQAWDESLTRFRRWFIAGAMMVFGIPLLMRFLAEIFPTNESLVAFKTVVAPGEDGSAVLATASRSILFLGTLVGVGVWQLRQKLRDLRSHEHLEDDANERVTMIDTYAALRAAGLQDADMTPVLNALYRPASSGFIDDSGPATPWEIVVKSLTKQKTE